MKYLTIIRHAKSSWDNPGMADIERPLNERGRKATRIIGKYLKNKGILPDLLISSPAKRARDTAARIGKILGYPIENMEVNPLIYAGSIQDIRQILSKIDDNFNDVFLFGHEPLLSSLIHGLSGENMGKFSTCSVYRMSFDIKNWALVGTQKGKCEFFVYPKMLLQE